MQEKEFIRIAKMAQASEMVTIVNNMDADARRRCAKSAMNLYKQVERFYGGVGQKDPQVLDQDASVVAVLGTATFEEVIDLKHLPVPVFCSASEIYSQLHLPWLQSAVEQLICVEHVFYLEPLWLDGVCSVPNSDAVIHGYFDTLQSHRLNEQALLDGLVWRFFETEGTHRYGLPVHDKWARHRRSIGLFDRGLPWADRLLGYEREGKLSRDQLLSASLSAIGTMSRGADIKWFAAFHLSLAPVNQEIEARVDVYDALTHSGHTSKAAFAKKCLRKLH